MTQGCLAAAELAADDRRLHDLVSRPLRVSKPALLSYLTDPQFLLIASLFLLLGGGIKGVIGLGLPLVSVPLLTYLLPVPVAISVLAAPVMVANCYQAMRGGLLVPVLRRIWPLLVAMVIGVLLGAQLLGLFPFHGVLIP